MKKYADYAYIIDSEADLDGVESSSYVVISGTDDLYWYDGVSLNGTGHDDVGDDAALIDGMIRTSLQENNDE